jgi:hypothetical protein
MEKRKFLILLGRELLPSVIQPMEVTKGGENYIITLITGAQIGCESMDRVQW